MFGLGTIELVLILFLVLIVFGAKKLPEVGKSIGDGIMAFKKSLEMRDEAEKTTDSQRKEE